MSQQDYLLFDSVTMGLNQLEARVVGRGYPDIGDQHGNIQIIQFIRWAVEVRNNTFYDVV